MNHRASRNEPRMAAFRFDWRKQPARIRIAEKFASMAAARGRGGWVAPNDGGHLCGTLVVAARVLHPLLAAAPQCEQFATRAAARIDLGSF